MGLILIIGISAILMIFSYIAFQLNQDHSLLQVLLLFMIVGGLILIPKAALDPECDLVVNGTTEINGTISYQYDTICKTEQFQTNTIFLKTVFWFQRFFVVYVFIYLNWFWWIKKVLIKYRAIKKPTNLRRK